MRGDRQGGAGDDRDRDPRNGPEDGLPDRESGALVGDEPRVVFKPGETKASWLEQVPREKAVVDRQHKRDLRHEKDVDERRQEGKAPGPCVSPGNGGGGITRASTPDDRTEDGTSWDVHLRRSLVEINYLPNADSSCRPSGRVPVPFAARHQRFRCRRSLWQTPAKPGRQAAGIR